jgi:hypothetical protein
MKHLSRTEFVDLLDSFPPLPEERVRHAETCAECRAQLDALRDTATAAREDADAEPSPLFWDHFAARVAAAVRDESVPARTAPWLRAPILTSATVASIVMLLVVGAVWRTTLHAPSPAQPIAPADRAPDIALSAPPRPDNADDDEAWAIVRAAAIDLNWDEVHAAGISAHPDDVENVALELTADERVELARLLDKDLKRNGA